MIDREALVFDNQGLVVKLAATYGQTHLREDLIQAGLEALVIAVKTYDPEKGAFSTHAWRRIQTAMQRCVRDDHTIGLTDRFHLDMRRINATVMTLESRHEPVTIEAIVKEACLSFDEVEAVLKYHTPNSLDYTFDEDGRLLHEEIGDPDSYAGIELRDLMSRISDYNARAVLSPQLGFLDKELAEMEGVSVSTIHLRRQRGLKELRAHARQN